MDTTLIKPIIRFGNSAGVLLPKEWLNGKARIELVQKPLEIAKEVLEILSPYLEDLLGIYLVGSYARGDQEENSDIDVLAISRSTKKEISEGKYSVSIYPLESIKKSLNKNPLSILPRLIEAKTIFNSSLLDELKKHSLNENSIEEFVSSSQRILKINKDLFNLDKTLDENNIYSLVLRLRGFYIISCLEKKKPYSKEGFKDFLLSNQINFEEVYDTYRRVKEGKKVSKIKLPQSESLNLLNLLEEEIKKYGK